MTRVLNTKHSKRQRERILLALTESTKSCIELAARLHMDRKVVKEYLDAMLAQRPRPIHIAEQRMNQAGGRPTLMYGIGNGPDAVYEPSRTPKRHLINAQNEERVLAMLEDGPMTASQIARDLGKHISHARRIIARLRVEPKRIHVCDWSPLPKATAAIYALGDMPDVERAEVLPEKRKDRHAFRHTGWAAALGI